jgi:AcrR family transcriptional regulator
MARKESLSRDRIIDVAVELLDSSGETGLTFRTLAAKLATGPGAIYWHVPNKSALLTAACDAIVARTLASCVSGATPGDTIRAVAAGLFDAIAAHPWVGAALGQAPADMPMVRILEKLGPQVQALGLPEERLWAVVGALLNYILGVGSRHAANVQLSRTRGIARADFLDLVATTWSRLDQQQYPFTHGVARQVRGHDDRVDFLAGIDLILAGIEPAR